MLGHFLSYLRRLQFLPRGGNQHAAAPLRPAFPYRSGCFVGQGQIDRVPPAELAARAPVLPARAAHGSTCTSPVPPHSSHAHRLVTSPTVPYPWHRGHSCSCERTLSEATIFGVSRHSGKSSHSTRPDPSKYRAVTVPRAALSSGSVDWTRDPTSGPLTVPSSWRGPPAFRQGGRSGR